MALAVINQGPGKGVARPYDLEIYHVLLPS
jgi:hypothetical protein